MNLHIYTWVEIWSWAVRCSLFSHRIQKWYFLRCCEHQHRCEKKKLHTRKHFKKLVFRVFHVLERKVFFFDDGWFIFFRSEDGGISWFLVKINENKGKTLVFDSFPLFFIDLGGFLGKSWNATIFGLKKINHPSSKKNLFW